MVGPEKAFCIAIRTQWCLGPAPCVGYRKLPKLDQKKPTKGHRKSSGGSRLELHPFRSQINVDEDTEQLATLMTTEGPQGAFPFETDLAFVHCW